jgi:15-cis-phytoene synthase
MKALFDHTSNDCSKIVTQNYSTSFSHGIYFLGKNMRNPIYGIYGFVRLADEIVDTFHDYDKVNLMAKFRQDTLDAIEQKISLNPILNSFQHTVREYNIEWELVDTFLKSMEMDLNPIEYDQKMYEKYILGSAEVVGLMCLRVFTQGEETSYLKLKPYAMKLGAAFQKVNFLRDLKADYQTLGRTYFPGINFNNFDEVDMQKINIEISDDFAEGLNGIRGLPLNARLGVFLAYYYYTKLFKKIIKTPAKEIMRARIRIPNSNKLVLVGKAIIRNKLNWLS